MTLHANPLEGLTQPPTPPGQVVRAAPAPPPPKPEVPEAAAEQAIKIQIQDDEGVSNPAKPDRGGLVVGRGHKVKPEDKIKEGDRITPERQEALFEKDFKVAEAGARRILRDLAPQPPEVRQVLTNMVFQLGEEGVKKFKNFLAALKARNFVGAAKEMVTTNGAPNPWVRQTPERAMRLAEIIAGLR